MAKYINLKSGSKNRHDSLYRALMQTEDEAWNQNFNEFVALQRRLIKGNQSEVESLIAEHLTWLDQILTAEGISEDFILDENSAKSVKPVVLASINAKSDLISTHQLIGLAFNDSTNETWQYLFMRLLGVLPKLLIVQEAVHETAILDLKKRSKPIRDKAKQSRNMKRQQIELCQPEYRRIKELRPNFSNSDIARHLKVWMSKNHGIDKAERTIRSWIKEM